MTTQNACSTLARTLAFRYSIWSMDPINFHSEHAQPCFRRRS